MRYRIVYEDRGATALFRQLSAKLGDPLPITQDMAGRMEASIQRNFDEQGRPDRWAPLKPSTLMGWAGARKSWWTRKGKLNTRGAAAMAGRKILTDTGRLRRSIVARAYRDRVEISSRVRYALFHQDGTRKMPARPFLLVQREDWDYFLRRWSEWLIQK